MLGCTAKTLRKYLKQDLVEEEGAEDAARLLKKIPQILVSFLSSSSTWSMILAP